MQVEVKIDFGSNFLLWNPNNYCKFLQVTIVILNPDANSRANDRTKKFVCLEMDV